MTTQAFPANAVNLFLGTPADAATGSMTITMKTARYYIEGTRMVKGQDYIVTRTWGKMAVEQGWATDKNAVLPVQETPQVLTGTPSVIGTGTPAIDYPALQGMVASLPSTGGSIRVIGRVNLGTNTLVVDKPIRFFGDGSSDAYSAESVLVNNYANAGNIASSTIQSTSTTGVMIQVNSVGVSFEGIHFSGPLNATSGAGMVLGTSVLPANGFCMDNCSFYGFWQGLRVVFSAHHTLTNSKWYTQVQHGISYEAFNGGGDECDCTIMGCGFNSGNNIASPEAAINWIAGGGLKFIGNKINSEPPNATVRTIAWRYGIRLAPANAVNTGVILINDNSIENTTTAGIYITSMTASNGGSIGGWTISDNEFLAAGRCIDIVSDNGGINRGYIGNNVAITVGSFLRMNYAVGIRIGPNDIFGALLTPGTPVIDIDNGVDISYKVEEQTITYRPANISIVRDNLAYTAQNSQRQGISRRTVREMPTLNLTPTAVDLFKLDIGVGNNAHGAEIEVTFAGFLSGPGAHVSKIRRIIYGNGAGTAAAATPAGWTDYHYSPLATTTGQVYLTWGFTHSAGVLTLQVACATGVGTPVLNSAFSGIASGEITLLVNGKLREIIVA